MHMKLLGSKALVLTILLLSCLTSVVGQTSSGLEQTWKGPDLTIVRTVVGSAGAGGQTSRAGKVIPRASNFTPTGNSAVAKTLADTLGRTATEKAALKEAFDAIKSGFDAELSKQGKANNVAAALAFFIVTNVMVFHDSGEPSDAASEELFKKLQNAMASSAEFARLTNSDKQQMYDWFVLVGGFALTNYQQAKSSNDAELLKTIREFAGYATQIVLGTSLESPATTSAASTAPASASASGSKIVGVWSISASNHAGSNLVTNAGYSKGEYHFNANGTYRFKSERWFGYLRSREFYTTEESGTYSVNGNSLTITPKTSKTIQRTPEGVVQKTQNNPLEPVTYKWQLHYFEGINETNLVLQPPRETARDGGFSSHSLFPNAYLYSQGSRLEWKF